MLNPREMLNSYEENVSADNVILKNTGGIYLALTLLVPAAVFLAFYFNPGLKLESSQFLVALLNSLFLSVMLANWAIDAITKQRLEAIGFKDVGENFWRTDAFHAWQKQTLKSEVAPLGYHSAEKRIAAYRKYIEFAAKQRQGLKSPYFKPAVILAIAIPLVSLAVGKAFALSATQFQFIGTILVLFTMALSAAAVYFVGREPLSTLFDHERRQLNGLIDMLEEMIFEEEMQNNRMQPEKPTMVAEIGKQDQPEAKLTAQRLGIPKAISIS